MRSEKLLGVLLVILLVMLGAARAQSAGELSPKEEGTLKRLLRTREHSRGFNLYSLEDERQMGEEVAVDIEEHAKILRDDALTEYLDGLGRKVAEQSQARGTTFHFKVIVDDEINAVALPNGSVYVNSGLIIASESEAELASVLAHEIAHVASRHASRAATRKGIWGAARLGAAMFGGGLGVALQPAMEVASSGVVMKFSRDAEREADVLGLEYLYGAGYDAEAFVRFMVRTQVESSTRPGLLNRMNATHPPVQERIRLAKRTVELALPHRELEIDDTSEFVEARERVLRATHPEMMMPRPVLRLVKGE